MSQHMRTERFGDAELLAQLMTGDAHCVFKLIDLVWTEKIQPGEVFDLEPSLEQIAEGYAAMDQRRSIKTPFRP